MMSASIPPLFPTISWLGKGRSCLCYSSISFSLFAVGLHWKCWRGIQLLPLVLGDLQVLEIKLGFLCAKLTLQSTELYPGFMGECKSSQGVRESCPYQEAFSEPGPPGLDPVT